MITRLYINNFRCLVAFEIKLDLFAVLCGFNGTGKSSVFDALRLIRNLATEDGILGGEGEKDIQSLEFTNWMENTTQEFEVEVTSAGHVFEYLLHIEQKAEHEKPRIVKEEASCDGKKLFERDLEGVRFTREDGSPAGFPLDWRRAALASIQPKGALKEIALLQEVLAKLLILCPNPCVMEPESKVDSKYPNPNLANLISWYRSLSQDYKWTATLHDYLKSVWPDFNSLRLLDMGRYTKTLQLRFESTGNESNGFLDLEQLSDGEKMLLGIYMILAALKTDVVQTILIDEPDNYIGLPELQPWVMELRELLDDEHQVILITHHSEILNSVGKETNQYLWRDNHASPTRIAPLDIPEGLTPGETIARGWVNE